MRLSFGFTPCPNDAFAFHALVHGLVPAPFEVEPVLLDIEELNQRAVDAELPLTKLSFGAAAAAGARYRLLRSGAALGRGVGPLVVAREASSLEAAAAGRVAVPGRQTTAVLLLRLAAPALGEVVELRYDRILDAVVAGEVDAGLIIHESRFTYADQGLVSIADLGEWWDGETGLPVPLAGIFARSDLEPEKDLYVEGSELQPLHERAAELLGGDPLPYGLEPNRAVLEELVEYAFAHPEASRDYVRSLSKEMSDDVCAAHIALYVNEHSVDIGDEGLAAVERLLGHATAAA